MTASPVCTPILPAVELFFIAAGRLKSSPAEGPGNFRDVVPM